MVYPRLIVLYYMVSKTLVNEFCYNTGDASDVIVQSRIVFFVLFDATRVWRYALDKNINVNIMRRIQEWKIYRTKNRTIFIITLTFIYSAYKFFFLNYNLFLWYSIYVYQRIFFNILQKRKEMQKNTFLIYKYDNKMRKFYPNN